MISLVEAIQATFEGSAALTSSFPAGLFLDTAPDSSDLPICRMNIISAPNEFETSSGSFRPIFEKVSVQFDVFSTSNLFCFYALADIDLAYQFKSLVVPGAEYDEAAADQIIAGYRTAGPIVNREDERVWHGYATYLFTVVKPA